MFFGVLAGGKGNNGEEGIFKGVDEGTGIGILGQNQFKNRELPGDLIVKFIKKRRF